jgi:hypothetical protein
MTSTSVVGAFAGAFILLSILRIPTALMEHYVISIHLKWIYWPHGVAVAITIALIASLAGSNTKFKGVISTHDTTYAILIYLVWAFMLMAITALAVWLHVRLRHASARIPAEQCRSTGSVNKKEAGRYQVSRNAAAFALSIIVGIAGIIQGLDLHHLVQTVIALAIGTAGLYFIMKLPSSHDKSG